MFIDLSLPLHNDMPVYEGDPEVKITKVHHYNTHSWELRQLTLGSHTGTHVDAPSHMHKGAKTLSDLPIERFCGVAQIVKPHGLFPCGCGLFFIEAVDITLLDKLLAAHPRFVGGAISEMLERALLAQGIITYTDLINLEKVGTAPFMFYGFPLAIAGGDGSPVRAVAHVTSFTK